jgi:hypothetical protein
MEEEGFMIRFQTGLWDPPALYSMVKKGFFLEGKAAGS